MYMEIYSLIATIATLIAGGGWFINRQANKRKANGEATQAEANAFKTMQDAYQRTIEDVNKTLIEVRGERDYYKDQNDLLVKERDEMREKYKTLEDRMNGIENGYKNDIARLGRRISAINPFLCGKVGCVDRIKVELDKDSKKQKEKNDTNGNI